MDVQLGHCWRCEQPISHEVVPCTSCGIAKYCTDVCRLHDQYRHKPQCEEWGPRKCDNPTCSVTGQLKECAACSNSWYCGAACQKQHWKEHRRICRQHVDLTKSAAAQLYHKFHPNRVLPLQRPYYIGNNIAVDMLNLPANECAAPMVSTDNPEKRDYTILSGGCGNLRNWIHTVASLPQQFQGRLHTVLNDCDPFVQARNVLHLYMMFMVDDDDREIAARITTIWYSLHLPEKEFTFLVECLVALQDQTAHSLSEITGGMVHLSEAELIPMREVWHEWLQLECRRGYPKYIDLDHQRKLVFTWSPGGFEGQGVYRHELPEELRHSFDEFLESGDFLPSGTSLSWRDARYDNPTFTGYNDEEDPIQIMASPKTLDIFIYCIGNDLYPFSTWDYLKVKMHHYRKSLVSMFHAYITDQIKLTMDRLKAEQLSVSIIVWDGLDLQTRINAESCKFDRIFTSNIADYMGTPRVLQAMKPFLNRENKCATVVTQYFNWQAIIPQAKLDGPSVDGTKPVPERDSKYEKVMGNCVLACIKDSNSGASEADFKNPRFMANVVDYERKRGNNSLQEYYNCMIWFITYLRAEALAFLCISEAVDPAVVDEPTNITKQAPLFQRIKQCEGFRLRDFRRGELNKVVPFQYRRNIRQVNLSSGMSRMLEWHWPCDH